MKQSLTTKPTWYVDAQEQVFSSREINRHHMMFEANRYIGSRLLKDLRNLPGFFPHYMPIVVHKELHKHLERGIGQPIIPNDDLIHGMIHLQKQEHDLTPLERLDTTINYLGRLVAAPGVPTPNSRDAWDLLDNLQQQRPFIERGRVTLLQQ